MSKPKVKPVVWHPPAAEPDTHSALPELRVYPVPGTGPEDVLLAPDGSVLTGIDDGSVLRIQPETGGVEVLLSTGGRPLGLEWLPDGRLLICDAERGLLAAELDGDREIEVLLDTVDHRKIRICNNAGVAPDGTIWFTDSSARFDLANYKGDLIEHSGTGRLIRRDPDGSATTVVTGLQFANGVALAPDGSAVFFAETGSYSLSKIETNGLNAGRVTVVEHALPGFPDNISPGTDGLIWVAIASPRNPIIDKLAPLPPFLRKAVWALPERLQPAPEFLTRVLAVEPTSGDIVHDYAGEHADFGVSTGVREHHGTVWMGSLTAGTVASFVIPQ